MDFNWLPAGEFRMGARGRVANEEPPHLVRLSGFYMGIFPVTQEQFAVWTQAKQIDHKNNFPGRPQHPAETLDWHKARRFCEWLNSTHHADLPTGFGAALPSEAQWEYACRLMKDRSGNPQAVETEYYTGDGEAALVEAGWYRENARSSTQPVGQKKATDFGLYDLHGNVWEWCRDEYDADAYKRRVDGVLDPVVMATDWRDEEDNAYGVMRGGCCWLDAALCTATLRTFQLRNARDGDQGFRIGLFSGHDACPAEKEARMEIDLGRSNLPSNCDPKIL